MALSHPWFLPWPLLAFPVTCNDLTWEGGCSTAGWLQGLFWVCRPGVTLSSYRWLFPSVTDPTHGLCFGMCLCLYQELLAFTTFSLVMPQSRKASFQLLSAPGLQTVWNNEGFAGFTCGQLYLTKISWGFLNNTVFKITKIQSLQILLWTFHSHAQTVLHVLCRQGEIISKETLYAFLDDILLLPYCFFFCLFFLPAPSYINSVSSSFRDRWWAGGTNELPAAQGRRIEMLCALRTNRLSTLTEDVTHVMKGLMHKYCCRLFFTDTYEPCFPKRTTSQNSLPNSPILTVFIGVLLWMVQ